MLRPNLYFGMMGICIFTSAVVLAAPFQADAAELHGTVTEVISANTIIFKVYTTQKVRLSGIAAPKPGQDYSAESKTFVENQVLGKEVTIFIEQAQFGEVLGIVVLEDGGVLNEELLKRGYAWYYPAIAETAEMKNKYSELERDARSRKVGIWSQEDPVPPFVAGEQGYEAEPSPDADDGDSARRPESTAGESKPAKRSKSDGSAPQKKSRPAWATASPNYAEQPVGTMTLKGKVMLGVLFGAVSYSHYSGGDISGFGTLDASTLEPMALQIGGMVSDNVLLAAGLTLAVGNVSPDDGPATSTHLLSLRPRLEYVFGNDRLRPFAHLELGMSAGGAKDKNFSIGAQGIDGGGGFHFFITDSFSFDFTARLLTGENYSQIKDKELSSTSKNSAKHTDIGLALGISGWI